MRQTPTDVVCTPMDYLTLLYGPSGVGKTTWCSQIPGHYFHVCEMGIKGLRVVGESIFDWKGWLAACNEVVSLKENGWKDADGVPQRPVDAIVIDTIERLYDYCATHVCATESFMEKGIPLKYTKIDDVPFGRGYKRTAQLIIDKIEKLRLNGFGVFMISHTKEKEFSWNGQKFDKMAPNLPGNIASEMIIAACDAVGYFSVEEKIEKKNKPAEDGGGTEIIKCETGRFAQWQCNFYVEAKHRLTGFPERLVLGRKDGWQTYVNAFQETAAQQ